MKEMPWNIHMVSAFEDQRGGEFQCNFVGPVEMGLTRSTIGIFQILDRLCRCVDWGNGEYQQWVNSEVLAKSASSPGRAVWFQQPVTCDATLL